MISKILIIAFKILEFINIPHIYDHHTEEASKDRISYLEFLDKLLWAEIEAKKERVARTS